VLDPRKKEIRATDKTHKLGSPFLGQTRRNGMEKEDARGQITDQRGEKVKSKSKWRQRLPSTLHEPRIRQKQGRKRCEKIKGKKN